MKSLALACLAIVFTTALFAGEVTLHGSTSMLELNQRLAASFQESHAGIKIAVVGNDSGQGIADLLKGATMLAASSRAVKDAETAKFREAGRPLVVFPVARDGVVVYVHNDNRVRTLTMAQLTDVFSGKTTNWKELGGDNAPIQVYVREASSGTQQFFRERVMGSAPYAAGAKEAASAAAVVKAVTADKNAIGYASPVFTKSVQAVSLRANGAAVAPSRDAVVAGTYPLSRIFYYLAAGTPTGEAMTFVRWVLSPAGQQAVTKAGFYALK